MNQFEKLKILSFFIKINYILKILKTLNKSEYIAYKFEII